VSRSIWGFGESAHASREVLIEILKRREAIGAEKERVRQSRSGCAGMFLQKAKQIDGEIEQLRPHSVAVRPRTCEPLKRSSRDSAARGRSASAVKS
jgi:hypothetical protein